MKAFQPKPPDFRLKLQTRTGKRIVGDAGAGWINEAGGISVHLNPGVSISWKDDLQISLWPAEKPPEK